MNTPIRKEGLQIEAVLCMGNSLYSILLATVIGSMAILLQRDTLFFQPSGLSNIELAIKLSGFITVFLLSVYYIFDWHDLNQVPYFDEKIGMTQMVKWMTCIIIITLCTVLSLNGKNIIAALLTGFYIPFVIGFRDHEFGLTSKETTPQEGYDKAFIDIHMKRMQIAFKVVAVICSSPALITVFYLTPWKDAAWLNISITILTTLCWLLALICKISRGKHFILVKYKQAIESMQPSIT